MPKIIPPFSNATDRGYKFLRVFDQYYVARGGRLVLYVEGGIAPYDWEVTGTDFTLDEAQTNVQYNFITVDDAAVLDNVETVTITDANSQSVTIDVCTCNPTNCEDDPSYSLSLDALPSSPMGCESALVSVTGGCPPYHWELSEGVGDISFDVDYTNHPTNRITCTDADCECDFCITVTDGAGSSAASCTDCPPAVSIAFDDDNTPNTIAPGGSIFVYVTDGQPPYNWSVSGLGYTLDEMVTTIGKNTLNSASGV